MSSLPLLFKKEGLIEKHQVEGVDPSDRYFNRTVLVNRTASGYAAKVMYEALNVEGHPSNHHGCGTRAHRMMQRFGLAECEHAPIQRHEVSRRKETWIDYADLA